MLGVIVPLPMYNKDSSSSQSTIKHTIAIAAGKGGVGKSTLTVNLGLTLKKMGFRVGIMDTDIYGPSIRKMLPEDRMPSQQGNLIIPALSGGMPMISMAYFRREDEAAAVRAPIANGVVSQFINDVVWGTLDYLLIDFPPGTGDIQLTLSQKANLSGAVMITTPQEVAVMDVKKAMHLFEQVRVPIVGIVENMSYYLQENKGDPLYLFGKEGGKRLARDSGVPFLGEIPIDPRLSHCGDVGKSIFEDREVSPSTTEAFEMLATNVVEHTTLAQQGCREFELVWKEMS